MNEPNTQPCTQGYKDCPGGDHCPDRAHNTGDGIEQDQPQASYEQPQGLFPLYLKHEHDMDVRRFNKMPYEVREEIVQKFKARTRLKRGEYSGIFDHEDDSDWPPDAPESLVAGIIFIGGLALMGILYILVHSVMEVLR